MVYGNTYFLALAFVFLKYVFLVFNLDAIFVVKFCSFFQNSMRLVKSS